MAGYGRPLLSCRHDPRPHHRRRHAARPRRCWQVFGSDGSYQERIERGGDGTLERFGADGSYQGRYDRGRDGWDAFGPDGSYEGRISGDSERGLPAVIGGQDGR